MIPNPITIDPDDAIFMGVDCSHIILIQRGSENDNAIVKFLQALQKERVEPTAGGTVPGGPPKPFKGAPPVTINAVGFGIFATSDTSQLILIKKGSPNEQRILEFIQAHGKKLPRPPA